MLFAKEILPRAQRACTFDISADRNVWLQPALRSFAIVCDYMETALFAIVCDLRFAIRDRLRSSAIIWKPAFRGGFSVAFGSTGCSGSPGGRAGVNVECRRHELLGGPGACLPWEICKTGLSKMQFPAFPGLASHADVLRVSRKCVTKP